MGGLSRVLITGANGFVGAAAVREARARGIAVTAVYRRAPLPDWARDDGIDARRIDLAAPECAPALEDALTGCAAVIHAAAHLGEAADAVTRDTVAGTRHLLAALGTSRARLVLVSSVAVYDTMQLASGDTLTETSPLIDPDTPRDAYSHGKLMQERLVCGRDRPAWLMRAGAVYGPGRTWHALMGPWIGKLYVEVSSDGALPMVHVDHLAQALLLAAETDPDGHVALNVIDDDRPDRARYAAAHRKLAGWPRVRLPIPYPVWLLMARLFRPLGAMLPGLLREAPLKARMMPLGLDNTRLRTTLGGSDTAPFEQMLARSLEAGP